MSNERFTVVKVRSPYGNVLNAVLDRHAGLVAPNMGQTAAKAWNRDPSSLKGTLRYWETMLDYPLVEDPSPVEQETPDWAEVMLSRLADKIRAVTIECHVAPREDHEAWVRIAEAAVEQARKEGALP